MTYNELLQQKEWQIKCNEILNRDHYTCKSCRRIGFHNGGNFLELSDISDVDSILKDYTFYDRKFSEFIKTIPEDRYIEGRFKDIEYMDEGVEYEGVTFKHFKRPIIRDISDIDSFPIVFENGFAPTTIGQRNWHWGIKHLNDDERIGEIMEFTFLNGNLHSVCVSIEESDYAHHFTIQIGNRIFALIISRVKKSFVGLNIHHKFYIQGHKPWEYNDEALVTLCEDCHKRWHENYTNIRLYDSKGNLLHALAPCSRCGGSGYLPQYSHVEHGRCFKCGGEGVVMNDTI